MPKTTTILYADSLLFDPLLAAITSATTRIELTMYLFKTSYAEHTRANAIADALIAAAARGVEVIVVLNYARFARSVADENDGTGMLLAAGGCQVRLGPRDTELHAKIIVVDGAMVFTGSHNITRGALTSNRELSWYTESKVVVERAQRYIGSLWRNADPIAEVTPVVEPEEPLEIVVTDVAQSGAEIVLDFTASYETGVDAFAAVSSATLDFAGARIGATVPPAARTATIVPEVEAGDTVYVAVRAYGGGQDFASSELCEVAYTPTEPPPGEDEGEGEGSHETPPPAPLTAPTLVSVTRASDTTVTVTWAFAGLPDFLRFVIEQRDAAGDWAYVVTLGNPSTRTWTGAPDSMNADRPLRVVVYNTAQQAAASNEVAPPNQD